MGADRTFFFFFKCVRNIFIQFPVGFHDEDKITLLKKWIASGENLAACESTLTLTKTQEGEVVKEKELLTIKEMVDKNFSQNLGHICIFFLVSPPGFKSFCVFGRSYKEEDRRDHSERRVRPGP